MRPGIFRAFFWLLQWTWGILQNIAGLAVFLFYIKEKHFWYHGSIVTKWRLNQGSMGLGMFIFLSKNASGDTIIHEYGHTVQSVILGPLFLPVIGFPSLLWCGLPMFKRYRKKSGLSYYTFYPEKWANYLGDKFIKKDGEEFEV